MWKAGNRGTKEAVEQHSSADDIGLKMYSDPAVPPMEFGPVTTPLPKIKQKAGLLHTVLKRCLTRQ